MKTLLRRILVASALLAVGFAQLGELPLGSGPQVPECVDSCRIDFFNTTGVTRDCRSAQWDCNCKYTELWDHMACCIQDYCGDIDIEDADGTMHGFCTRIDVKGEFPSLLECKDDETETTSTAPKPTQTMTRREPTTTAQTTESGTFITSTRRSSETSDTASAGQTGANGQGDDAESSDSNDSGQPSTMAMGVGLGVGIPICAAGLGFLAFFLWRRNKNRQSTMDSPASDDHTLYSPGVETPKVEPESSAFIHELDSECRRAELPG